MTIKLEAGKKTVSVVDGCTSSTQASNGSLQAVLLLIRDYMHLI